MADLALRDAIAAVKNKISSAAADATPEELAYLGTAIDRIGGRATVLEIEQMGDTIKEELANIIDQVKAELDTYVQTATNTQIGVLDSRVSESNTAITNKVAEATGIIESLVSTANGQVTTMVNDAVAAIDSASAELSSAAAAAQQQAVSGSLFTNYFLASMG